MFSRKAFCEISCRLCTSSVVVCEAGLVGGFEEVVGFGSRDILGLFRPVGFLTVSIFSAGVVGVFTITEVFIGETSGVLFSEIVGTSSKSGILREACELLSATSSEVDTLSLSLVGCFSFSA